MRRYKRFNMTPEAVEQYELALKDDGSFVWLVTRSAAEGEGGTHDAHGTWTQTGDQIVFEVSGSSDGAPVPTTATVQGDRLDLANFGVFG